MGIYPVDNRTFDTTEGPALAQALRAAIVAAMAGCVTYSLVELGRFLVPEWKLGWPVVACCVLVALEAAYSYHLLHARQLRGTALLRFRLVELSVIFLIVRLISYVGDPWEEIVADIRAWPAEPFAILDPETMAIYLLVIATWWVATSTAHDMLRLAEPPQWRRGERHPLQNISGRFFWGGAVLLGTSGLARIGIALLLNKELPPVPWMVLNVLAYFLLGLALLGQANWVNLRQQWQAREAQIAEGVARRWLRYSIVLLGIAGVTAFLLPTRYTIGLLDVIMQAITIIVYVLTLAFLVISYLIGSLIKLLYDLLGLRLPRTRLLPFRLPPFFWRLRSRAPASGLPGWLEIVRAVFFWAVLTGVVVYTVRNYLRDHPEILRALRRFPLMRAILQWIVRLWLWVRGTTGIMRSRLARRYLRPQPTGSVPSQQTVSYPRTDTARDRILYYYMSILSRARSLGLTRLPTETPYEYATTFTTHMRDRGLPEAGEDMENLTDLFVEARYSPHPMGKERSQQARLSWQHLRAALRALRRQRGNTPDI